METQTSGKPAGVTHEASAKRPRELHVCVNVAGIRFHWKLVAAVRMDCVHLHHL